MNCAVVKEWSTNAKTDRWFECCWWMHILRIMQEPNLFLDLSCSWIFKPFASSYLLPPLRFVLFLDICDFPFSQGQILFANSPSFFKGSTFIYLLVDLQDSIMVVEEELGHFVWALF